MNRKIVMACLTIVLFPLGALADDTAKSSSLEAQAATSRAAVNDLATTLKAQLIAAMKSGGPAAAISVCNVAATAISESVSRKVSGKVGRTALKLRNQKNRPDNWEKTVLETFVQRLKDGADPKTLEHYEIVTHNGQSNFRYMKPIMTGKPCLTCHGPEVSPSLRQSIKQLYPDDQAVGFAPGSLRGAFTVTRPAK